MASTKKFYSTSPLLSIPGVLSCYTLLEMVRLHTAIVSPCLVYHRRRPCHVLWRLRHKHVVRRFLFERLYLERYCFHEEVLQYKLVKDEVVKLCKYCIEVTVGYLRGFGAQNRFLAVGGRSFQPIFPANFS